MLGDSLSSTEARCNAVFPWPMLLQDALGREQFTVHGFALPGVHAQNYADTDVWTRAITTTPDILAIMLGTNDAKDPGDHGPNNWLHNCGGPDHTTVEGCTFAEDYGAMIKLVKTLGTTPAGPKIYVAIPPPLMQLDSIGANQ